MKNFEIHITTNKSGLDYFKEYDIPFLEIDMLDKDLNFIQKDYMCSLKLKFNNFEECEEYTRMTAHCMLNHFNNDIKVYRMKIESEPLKEYFDKSLYIESHWEIDKDLNKSSIYPISHIVNKDKYVATARVYNKDKFNQFSKNHLKSELCLFDTNIEHDQGWFKLYND